MFVCSSLGTSIYENNEQIIFKKQNLHEKTAETINKLTVQKTVHARISIK